MTTLSNFKLVGIDSNIFIYYFEENPQFAKASKKIFDGLSVEIIRGVTSVLTLAEVLSKKGLPDNIARNLEESFFEIPNLSILEVNRSIAKDAAKIRRKYGFRIPDAIQLATAVTAHTQVFITNDARLKKFKEIKVILLKEL